MTSSGDDLHYIMDDLADDLDGYIQQGLLEIEEFLQHHADFLDYAGE